MLAVLVIFEGIVFVIDNYVPLLSFDLVNSYFIASKPHP
jgi:hypothetical protein